MGWMYKCTLILAFLLLLSESFAQEVSIGVSPGLLDLGEIEKGSSKISRFHVVTPSNKTLLVELSAPYDNPDIFNKEKYKNFISNYSEEDCGSWIKFLENPAELKPTGQTLSVGKIKGWREIIFIVDVPEDAEPGYHTRRITPNVRTPEEPGKGIMIKTLTNVNLIFKVPGTAIRSGKILDVTTGKYIHESLELRVFFQNTGTVTIIPYNGDMKIYDSTGRLVDTLSISGSAVKPGEVGVLTALWDTRNLNVGDYKVVVTLDIRSDQVSKESVISLYELPKPVLPAAKVVEEAPRFPWFLLLVVGIIIIAAYYFYKR